MAPTTYKFAPNVQAKVDAKYLDIVPGTYGPQVRVKGKVDGKEAVAYLPGKITDVITSLITSGVIARGDYPVEVEKAFELKALKREFNMMKRQAAGEKNGTLAIWNVDLATPEEAKAVAASAPANQAPANAGAAGAATPSKSYADIYVKATDFIINTIVPKYRAAKLEPSAADVHAMVATLFIPKSKES